MDQKLDFSILKTLTQLPGVSGREDAVRQELAKHLAPVAQNIRTDALGNLLAYIPGTTDKNIILCAHMDEVGLMVKYISDEGFLSFVPVGGIDPRTLLAQRVHVHTRRGVFPGVIGTKPAHITSDAERARAVAMGELFIDIGFSGQEALKRVELGDFVTLDRPFIEFGKGRFCAKAFDNRAGCFCLLEAVKRIKKPLYGVHIVFSSQEEVGLRGAGTAAFGLDADLALAIDTTGAADIPLCHPQDYLVCLGQGVAVSAIDSTTITPAWLFEGLKRLCRNENIAYQVRIAPRGGNDAGALHRSKSGIASCALSIPTRNIHSNVEVVDRQDIVSATDLLCAVLEKGVSRRG